MPEPSPEDELTKLRRENDIMRAIIAKSYLDCLYCGLPGKEISRCASGFPGCGRMDDIDCDPRPAEEVKINS